MAVRKSYLLPNFEWTDQYPLIEMKDIHKIFHSTAGDVTVLQGINVQIQQGEFVSVVGRSGSGKSTLVNMITGIDRPSGGSVRVGDTVLHKMNEGRMAVWRGKHLGIVFQFFQLLPMLTLIENVMLPMDFCNMYAPAEREERALKLLKRVGIDNIAHKLPGAVSGGQQQSAAVARALANDPPILIADEPTGNLDSKTAEEIMQLFEELASLGKTLLMVTHDSSLAKRTSRTLLISDGEMVREAIARALPTLPHEQLLRLSHSAHELTIPPGNTLPAVLPYQQPVILVANGILEIVRSGTHQVPGEVFSKVPRWNILDLAQLNGQVRGPIQLRSDSNTPLELMIFEKAEIGNLDSLNSIPVFPPNIPPAKPHGKRSFFDIFRRSA